jgi:hypothetical protein
MALEVNLARHSNLGETKIGFFDNNGILKSALKWEFAEGKSSGDMITYVDVGPGPDGVLGTSDDTRTTKTITAAAASEMVNDAGKYHTFRTIK